VKGARIQIPADPVYVDERNQQCGVYRFDPASEKLGRFVLPRDGTNLRQILVAPGKYGYLRAAPNISLSSVPPDAGGRTECGSG
jgi:hypothetical protein